MSKYKLVNVFDKIFVNSAIFLIIYAWINFYLKNLWVTFILSLIFTSATVFIIHYISNKKQNAKILNKKDEFEINKNFYAFKLTNKQEKLILLNKIINLEHKTTLKENYILFTKNNEKHIMILATEFNVVDDKILINLLESFNLENIDAINVVCESSVVQNNKIFKNKKINFITKKILYFDYFFKHKIYPDCSELNMEKQKFNIKTLALNLFVPQKAKSYLFCGSILIFSSIILPYNYYYIIVGSMLLMFGIICKLLPKIRD